MAHGMAQQDVSRSRRGRLAVLAAASALLGSALAGCQREGEERALADLEVGAGASAGMQVAITGGLAHVLDVQAGQNGTPGTPGEIRLRASAPAFAVALEASEGAAGEWIVTVSNCMPDAELTASVLGTGPNPARIALPVVAMDSEQPTLRRWRLDLSGLPMPGATGQGIAIETRIEPPDAAASAPGETWRFAVMGDIQRAMPRVHQVFERISEQPDLRFVVSTGDLVSRGYSDEYDLLETKLETLSIPYYSTIGNHELFTDPAPWRQRFGRFNLHFRFKGVAFSLVDSGSASLDPLVYTWLDEWLEAAADDVHLFFTHYPPRDPIGVRDGAFRSANEARKLLEMLAAGNVDMTFYGHIHSYYAFSNAGIPAYISGGGGAIPERWDGIGRHFLVVEVSAAGVAQVAVVRVD